MRTNPTAPVAPFLPLSTDQKRLLNEPGVGQMIDLFSIIHKAIANFEGNAVDLERAIGCLIMCQHFGWKPMRMFHSNKTFVKFENILGYSLRENFDFDGEGAGPAAPRSPGYQMAESVGYWAYTNGKTDEYHNKSVTRKLLTKD